MKEKIFNLFLHINDNVITSLSVVVHELPGSDEEKLNFLQQSVANDVSNSDQFKVPSRFRVKKEGKEFDGLVYERYIEMINSGTDGYLFEEIYKSLNAGPSPLICVSTVVDGELKVDKSIDFQFDPTNKTSSVIEHVHPDYFGEYFNEEGFRFADLINDDFYEGVRLTFKNGLYVSSIKLMMSFIDTLAYLEFGDVQGNFMKWLDEYADLSPLKITSVELWEFRNSILHMTNLNSRKIREGKISRLRFYIAENGTSHFDKSEEYKNFNYKELIAQISLALDKWCSTFDADRTKITNFVSRYDEIVSDRRYGYVRVK